ncbi:predicted protein [Naegleria gruberi]|uniref:Predicted protein n=1 Tax=Naegleria gruberi TaxID=5762 RepID=D2VPD6_NAEGR|nr:uncharacterized protein NAEGRDRAFT_70817 [Naegleria gruberi]EFC41340.1 predicted protein [Naegleria gruberi]|eukprot:XP_002674084.1 predicted protein [Naegleria gruberi strain NEG-M]
MDVHLPGEAIVILNYYLDLERNSFGTVLESVTKIRKFLSSERDIIGRISTVVESRVLERIVNLLDEEYIAKFFTVKSETNQNETSHCAKRIISQSDLISILYETSWLIINVVSGNYDHTNYIVSCGVISKLVKLLKKTNSSSIIDQCIWALGNIAGESVEFRNLVLDHNIMEIMVELMQNYLLLDLKVLNRGWL